MDRSIRFKELIINNDAIFRDIGLNFAFISHC